MKKQLFAILAMVAAGSAFAQAAPVGTLTTNAAGQVISTIGGCSVVVPPGQAAPVSLAQCQAMQQAQAVANAGGGAGGGGGGFSGIGGLGATGTLVAGAAGLGALAYQVNKNANNPAPISNN